MIRYPLSASTIQGAYHRGGVLEILLSIFHDPTPCGLTGVGPPHLLDMALRRPILLIDVWTCLSLCLLLLAVLGRAVAQWATAPSKTIHIQHHRLVAISLLTYAQVWDNSRA